MGAKSNVPVVREDVLRGIRWGMIVLIAALLAIAAYRVFGTSPASAAPKPDIAPRPSLPAAQAAPQPAIEAGDGAPSEVAPGIKGPDVPPAPPARRQKAPLVPDDHAKAFIPPSVTTPRAAMAQDITSALPDAPAMDMKAAPVAVASDKVNAKQQEKGSRVGKVAKSVGKIFGFGRKESPEPGK